MMNTPQAAGPDPRDQDLAYLANRAFDPQWRLFLDCLSGELFENFAAEEACGFFRHIGIRMASQFQPAPTTTLGDLEQALNQLWQGIGWGRVQLAANDHGLVLVHRAFPGSHAPVGQWWRQAFAAVLEGLYTMWLQGQGGDQAMRAVHQEDGATDALVFRFGY